MDRTGMHISDGWVEERFDEGGVGRAITPNRRARYLQCPRYIRTPNGTFSRSILRDARPLYYRRDEDANEDDSQCTLQRFYVINTDALARI